MDKIKKTNYFESLSVFSQDIALAHSVFALPFAGVGFLLAEFRDPSWSLLLNLIICMVSARTFAMGINRILDRDIDKANPRTAQRAIPSGKLSMSRALVFAIIVFGNTTYFD